MSIEKLPDGRIKVRWRDAMGSHRGKTFPKGKLKEARDYERARLWDRDHGGTGAPDMQLTLLDVGAEFRDKVIARKQPKTQTLYRWLWNRLIVEQLGPRPINRITAPQIEDWLADLNTGDEAKRKAASLLSQIFKFAQKRGYCILNPVSLADRPAPSGKKLAFCPPPEMVEGVRKAMFHDGRVRDAFFVSVLAYAGLRPGEARRLTWDDWTNDTLTIYAPKTDAWRAVKVLEPLAEDLAAWKQHATSEVMFPGERIEQWTDSAYNNWAKRVWRDGYQPHPEVTPYKLRHAYVSLLLRDPDYSRMEIASWTGHSLEVQDKSYAHVLLKGQGSASEAIWEARSKVFGTEATEATGRPEHS